MVRPSKPPLGRIRDWAVTRVEYARRAGRGSAERRVIAIVGMHRSGTSAVAGTLQEAGLYLGGVLRKHDSNRKGTRENLGIVSLHDEILAYSGGSWRDLPETLTWTDEHRERRDRIVASFDGAELWGFKDPRTVLLLDFWREGLGRSLELVGVFREPGAVVSSLLARDGGTKDEWFSLWARYNEELLRAHEQAAFPLIEFGSSAEAFRSQVLPVLSGLGLGPNGTSFFDPALQSVVGAPDVPPEVARLYRELQAVERSR